VTILRRLSLAALVVAFAQVVFGAIVRITGSGMGCGDHWPKCAGYWLPPLDRSDLVIELTHRYLAVAIGLVLVALLAVAWQQRREPGVGGRGGVLRAILLATALVGVVGALGRVIVKNALDPLVIVVHLALAMSVLAALAAAVVRAGGFGAQGLTPGDATPRTFRAAAAAVGLTFVVLTFGALSANLPGAASACQGFPLCNGALVPRGGAAQVHLTHRILAFLLFFHMLGVVIVVAKRREPRRLVLASRVAFATVVLQILIAAALVERGLPPALQSLHQATGTLVWLATFTFALLARRATGRGLSAAVGGRHPNDAISSAARPPAAALGR
jgi:cytochrome c oxidase assembly protein subunit 15